MNNDRSRDYTMPAAPMMNTQPSILGQQPPSAAPQYNAGTQYMPGPEGYAGAPQSSAGWIPGPPAGPQSMPMQQMHGHPYMPHQQQPQQGMQSPGPVPTHFNGQNGYPQGGPPQGGPPQGGPPPRYHL